MTTSPYPSVTDELIAELEREAREASFVCCGQYVVGGEYMGSQEMICCGSAYQDGVLMTVESDVVCDLLAERAALIADAARLEWLADNLRMDFGTGDLARWSFDGLPHVMSNREECLVRDLRDFIDQQRMIQNDKSS